MIINNQYRFVFLHVPKTAGTTVSTALARFTGPADLDLAGTADPKIDYDPPIFCQKINEIWQDAFTMGKHSRLMRVRKRLGPRIWESYFKFAFVRNPYARTFSGFRFARQQAQVPDIARMGFSDFLRSEYFQVPARRVLPVRSQADFLHPLGQLDLLGRVERLAPDLALVMSIIARRRMPAPKLPVLNRSAGPDAWQAMSEADREIIRTALPQDFARLGYSPEDGSIVAPV